MTLKLGLFERVEIKLKMSEHEYRYAFYSPKRNEIALVRGIEIWTGRNNEKRFQYKTENNLYGSTMNHDKFLESFTEYLGDIGIGEDFYSLEVRLN